MAAVVTNATGQELLEIEINGQLVRMPLASVLAPYLVGATVASSPASGAAIVIPENTGVYVVRGSATLASLTLTLPQMGGSGRLLIAINPAITALTIHAPAGRTLAVAMNNAAIIAGAKLSYILDTLAWT
jgi:hypothetical protein